MKSTPKVYFYPHPYLRDRQLDVIRRWPRDQVLNYTHFAARKGSQVSSTKALKGAKTPIWKRLIPLPNIKSRPTGLPADAVVYVWGAVIASGPFIIDLDNPFALVGYNIPAMRLLRPILKRLLLTKRCLEIRCMSQACKETLVEIFGPEVMHKAHVHYPRLPLQREAVATLAPAGPRLLFISTQFEIKGGRALLRAFPRIREALPTATLDMITHLPDCHRQQASQPGVTVHPATFSREQIGSEFMARADVLVHPTYVDSFGMVVLEALSYGIAIAATDVYAMREMVQEGVNGRLVMPPISIWDDRQPSALYRNLDQAAEICANTDTAVFEEKLAEAIIDICRDPKALLASRQASLALFRNRFAA
jgi:glycosyltransferase involved in cell wall biosynthesis